MIEITPDVFLDENELHYEFMRASGPGGQNVNKVATAVQLRFDVQGSPSLPEAVKPRLAKLAGKRMKADGSLLIEAKRYRTQEQNRQDAEQRLIKLIQRALEKPKPRKPTRPSAAAREKRLAEKKRRSDLKRSRKGPSLDE
jgi:ribosome-associated protein